MPAVRVAGSGSRPEPVTAPETGAPNKGAPEALNQTECDGAILRPVTIRKRRDFLAAARARRHAAAGFVLQGRQRRESEAASGLRVGFTCSKKVGNAVQRNRAKRRLRAIAAAVLPHAGREGWDYVLIGRNEITAARPFTDLLADLEMALEKVHGAGKRR